jgi:hypothetical protein
MFYSWKFGDESGLREKMVGDGELVNHKAPPFSASRWRVEKRGATLLKNKGF